MLRNLSVVLFNVLPMYDFAWLLSETDKHITNKRLAATGYFEILKYYESLHLYD